MSISVVKPGLQTTLQSRPRSGMRHFGVPSSGAADPLSLALANRLVGNAWDAPALEATLLGPSLRMDMDCAFAITGATATVLLNGDAAPYHETVFARIGDELVIGANEQGARTYIAFAGGFAADYVLGSASTYLPASLGGFAGRALEAGDVLQTGQSKSTVVAMSTPDRFRPMATSAWALRTCEAPESAQLADEDALFDTNWTVGRRADRMGMQLEGPTLQISSDGRMPSAAVFPGTVQCPENGAPFVLSVDAGTVGGYPRIAQVSRADRHLLGQLRPGDHLRFLRRDERSAIDELREKHAYWREWIADIEQVI